MARHARIPQEVRPRHYRRHRTPLREHVDRLSRRACPESSYRSDNGLNFDIVCGKDFPGFDLDATTAFNIDDCMERCSNFSGDQCFMAVFEPSSGSCWLKTNDIDTDPDSGVEMSDRQAGIVHTDQFLSISTSCPFRNESTQATPDGPDYEIQCGLDLGGFDVACEGCPWHADSLQECMNLCQTAHPLCEMVSFNPDMAHGWPNCYPKAKPDMSLTYLADYVTHLAIAKLPNTHPDNCKDEKLFATGNGNQYRMSCNTDRPGGDIHSVHAISLESCLEQCSTYNVNGTQCVGVTHDAAMVNGWENCYLKNNAEPPLIADGLTNAFANGIRLPGPDDPIANRPITASHPHQTTTAVPDAAQGPTTTGTPVPTAEGDSQVWIAGVVLGVVAFLALLGGAFWWWRRRRYGGHSPLSSKHSSLVSARNAGQLNISKPTLAFAPSHEHIMEKHDNTFYQPPPRPPPPAAGYAEIGYPEFGYSNIQPPPSAGPLTSTGFTGTFGTGFTGGPPLQDAKHAPIVVTPPEPTELAGENGHYFVAHELDGNPRG